MHKNLDIITTDDIILTREPGAPGTWRYLSTRPHPQVDPNGNAMCSVLEAGDVGLVQLSCQLDPAGDELEALRSVIARESPSRAIIVLQSAVTAVKQIVVRSVSDDGATVELAASSGSGFAPFTAVFQLSLQGDQLDHARAALAGELGRLEIEYLLETVHGEARAAADVGAWFSVAADRTAETEPGTQIEIATVQEDIPC